MNRNSVDKASSNLLVAEVDTPKAREPQSPFPQPTEQPRHALAHAIGYYLSILVPVLLMVVGLAVRISFQTAFPYTPIVIVLVVLSQIGFVGSVFWSIFTLYGFFRYGAPKDRRPATGWTWDPRTVRRSGSLAGARPSWRQASRCCWRREH